MGAQQATQGGKKGRKFGRSKRGGAMARYNLIRRDQINKARKVAKHEQAVKTAAAKKATMVAHGTTRALRRLDMAKFRAAKQQVDRKNHSHRVT